MYCSPACGRLQSVFCVDSALQKNYNVNIYAKGGVEIDNVLLLILYSALFCMILIFSISAIGKGLKSGYTRYCVMLYANILCWLLCEMAQYASNNPAVIRWFFDIKQVFIAFAALSLFLMVTSFFHMVRFYPRWVFLFLCVLPAITVFIALTSPWHTLLLTHFRVVSFTPLTCVESGRGLWFYVNTVYCQLLAVSSAVMILRYFRTLPQAYRQGIVFMFACMIIYFIGFVIELFYQSNWLIVDAVDFNLVAVALAGVCSYMPTLANNRTDYAHIEMQAVLRHLDEPVFILDADKTLLDLNLLAGQILREFSLDPDFRGKTLDNIFEAQVAKGHVKIEKSEEDGHDYLYISNAGFSRIYLVKGRDFIGSYGQPCSFVILSEVTYERLLMKRFEEMADVDILTGLSNRYSYQKMLRQMDMDDNIPLSIIMVDVDGLKCVNDTLGHDKGDTLLRNAAVLLQRHCPENGHVFRIGGDEFVLLLPGTSSARAARIVKRIDGDPAEGLNPKPCMALGTATQTSRTENISELVAQADIRMYRNKKAKKSGSAGEAAFA